MHEWSPCTHCAFLVPLEVRRGHQSPWTEAIDTCEVSCELWELNSNSLEEQQVHLTIELLLQLRIPQFKTQISRFTYTSVPYVHSIEGCEWNTSAHVIWVSEKPFHQPIVKTRTWFWVEDLIMAKFHSGNLKPWALCCQGQYLAQRTSSGVPAKLWTVLKASRESHLTDRLGPGRYPGGFPRCLLLQAIC